MDKNEEKWKKKLTPEQFRVLRQKGTEAQFSGKYVTFDKKGEYVCAACGNPLFESDTKFEADCGWPSFDKARKDAVQYTEDNSLGMERIEVLCRKCGGHLGHLFDDGPTPSGKRYCINSVSLEFKEK